VIAKLISNKRCLFHELVRLSVETVNFRGKDFSANSLHFTPNRMFLHKEQRLREAVACLTEKRWKKGFLHDDLFGRVSFDYFAPEAGKSTQC